MLVKLLRHKLRGQKTEGKRSKKPSKRVALKARVEHALQWKPPSFHPPNKDAFLNNAAPGRLFDSNHKCGSDGVARSRSYDERHSSAGEEKKEDDLLLRHDEAANLARVSPEQSAPVESVLGKLAQVVISEYATGDEELHMFK